MRQNAGVATELLARLRERHDIHVAVALGVAEVLSGALKFDHWDVNRGADYILNLLQDKVLRKKVVRDASRNLKEITWGNSATGVMNAYASKNFI